MQFIKSTVQLIIITVYGYLMTKLTGRGLETMMVRCVKMDKFSESTAVADTNTGYLYSVTKNTNHTDAFPQNIANRTQIIPHENDTAAAAPATKGSYDDNHTMISHSGNPTNKAVSDSQGLAEMSTVRCDLGNITCQYDSTAKMNISLQHRITATDVEMENNNHVDGTRNNTFAGEKKLDYCGTSINVPTDIIFLNDNKTIGSDKADNQTLETYKYGHYYNCNNNGSLQENVPAKKPSSSWSSVVRNIFILVVCILAGLCARRVILRNRQRKRNIRLHAHTRFLVVRQL